MATLTTNRSKMVTNPARSNTVKPAHGGVSRSRGIEKQRGELIMYIQGKENMRRFSLAL
jgi:hypothetical protein